MTDYQALFNAVLAGERGEALTLSQEYLAAGVAPMAIINNGLLAAMAEVGSLFKEGELFVPEVMMSAATVAAVIEALKPLLGGEAESRGKVVIGTVKGDLHDIGKNLVALLLESNGFTVVDLGNDVPPGAFLAAARAHQADVVALSALLTLTMGSMKETIDLFAAEGERQRFPIIVGGAPLSPDYAREIGADGYGEDAQEAVDLCLAMMGGKQ